LKLSGSHSVTCREPDWKAGARLPRSRALPAGLQDWLFDPGSLTQRLRQVCPEQVTLQLLGQYRARPLPSEIRALRLERRSYVWIREVHLFCGDQPWVFARTLVPPATLRGRCRQLIHIGNRPLGELLFNDPGVKRGPIEVACLAPCHRLHRQAFGQQAERPDLLWGRRSIFRVDGLPLLICEIFLPDLLKFCSADQTRIPPL
jgi:chorismate--pyruvate lyase